MQTKAITVSELTQEIKHQLEDNIGSVAVQGELSNFKAHSSGHRYFTLKDEGSQISCVMWRTRQLGFLPTDGMKVVIHGSLTVYPPRGNYQIDCRSMAPLGVGDLYLAFEKLKKELAQLGYFDEDNKKPLPVMPMKIGVATSPTGAAVKDIFSTLERRFPVAKVYSRPAIVQGDGSERDIADAIEELNGSGAEVIIVGRGGGSIEDLWAFNTRTVADAIFNSNLPVISAVGHESDFTIADFVADRRAATPTAAAEIATPRTIDELNQAFASYGELLHRLINTKLKTLRQHFDFMASKNLSRRLTERINLYNQMIDDFELRNKNNVNNNISNLKSRINSLDSHCRSLYPLAPLGKGFAMLLHNGRVLSNEDSLGKMRRIEIRRKDETAEARVIKILPKSLFG